MIVLIFALAIFFAINMGGGNFSTCFAAAYGGKVLTRRWSIILFMVFVIIGAVIFGQRVTLTLAKDIVPAELITDKAVMIIFFSAGLSMFIANLMHIPQSTSLVTVAALAGVGAFQGKVFVNSILYMLPFWLLLPVLSYVITYGIARNVYPARHDNFWIYEKFVNQRKKLKIFVVFSSCYNAFSIGSNNV
ncbi:MAG: inorganic phosphate transporter, partial [Candidatus Omnitrophica bacterium]|nr:inorganic phosphate transporter [Candidatus Omnitrophota bacterium]